MNVSVFNMAGEEVGNVDLPESVFEAKVNRGLMHQALVRQLANARQGTHKAKGRSEVNRTTAKMYRQKGTGRARRGDIKSPLLRGGGVVFGPDGRTYAFKVPKKIRKLALKMALSSKLQTDELIVLDKFELPQIKTRDFINILSGLKLSNALIVLEEKNDNLELSSRNVPDIKVLQSKGLNVYDILKYKTLILLEPVIKNIERRLAA